MPEPILRKERPEPRVGYPERDLERGNLDDLEFIRQTSCPSPYCGRSSLDLEWDTLEGDLGRGNLDDL